MILVFVVLASACTLFSCADTSLPQEIKIEIPEGYHGNLHITVCSAAAARGGSAGEVPVVDCPTRGVRIELAVTQGSKVFVIPPEKLTIEKTGDGIPVAIEAHTP
jgi:hypothetical protein